MTAIGDWSAAVLCTDEDLRSLETNVLQWVAAEGSASYFRQSAKDQIEAELRQSFRNTDLETDSPDVLDLIADVTPLKYAAIYLTLHLVCNNCSAGGDQWEKKAEMYWGKYKEALPGAIGMLSLDIDQSGVVDIGEKYYLTQGVRMTRGGA
jgi:hypothetical protein